VPTRPTVIFRSNDIIVDNEQCEICVFENMSDEGSRLEIAVRRGEWEDLRIFLKSEEQKQCLGELWTEIRDRTKFGQEAIEAFHNNILGKLRFATDEEGRDTLII